MARIFAEYLAGAGLYAIAERPHPRPRPVALRTGSGDATATARARPGRRAPSAPSSRTRRYTGRQVWNRQRTRRGPRRRRRRRARPRDQAPVERQGRLDLVAEATHEALVSAEDYVKVQEHMAAGVKRPRPAKPRTTERPYLLRGLLVLRDLRSSHGWPAHAWRRLLPLPLPHRVRPQPMTSTTHAPSTSARTRSSATSIDGSQRCSIPSTSTRPAQILAAASLIGDVDETALEAARRKLEDCDTRLARYRSALESGADPGVVAQWVAEVQGDRLRAEQLLADLASSGRLDLDQVRARIEAAWPNGTGARSCEPTHEGRAVQRD